MTVACAGIGVLEMLRVTGASVFFGFPGVEAIQENGKSGERDEHGWEEGPPGMSSSSPKPIVRVKMEPETEESKNSLFYSLLREINPNNLENTEVSGYA